MWLRGDVYSRLRVRGQQGPLVRRRAHGRDEFLMLGGYARDVVADSPDTDKKCAWIADTPL